MKEIEPNNIRPRLKPGEALQPLPNGFMHIRVDGKIIGVSAPQYHDAFAGKSGYTVRQLRQIDAYRFAQRERANAVQMAEAIIYDAQSVYLRKKDLRT